VGNFPFRQFEFTIGRNGLIGQALFMDIREAHEGQEEKPEEHEDLIYHTFARLPVSIRVLRGREEM
jgi:hypothetical protein